MKVKKKKRKLKRWVIYLIIIILIILLLGICYQFLKPTKIKTTISQEQVLQEIVEKISDSNIDSYFLEWIDKEYKSNTTQKIYNYLNSFPYDSKMWHEIIGDSLIVLQDKYQNKYDNLNNIKLIEGTTNEITLSFVGDVSLADNWYIMPKYDERNKKVYGILSESVVETMTQSDLMIVNNEFTVSNRGEKLPNKYYTFRASPERLSIYEEMGVDLVTLANNHVYDFGEVAFNDMLDALEEYRIPYIGAGRNINDATRPYYFIINGYKIAFVNAARAEKYILTPEATETEGGVFRCYDPELLKETIAEAKSQSDYVIALIHWGKEDSHELESVQKETSRIYIDAGADIIIGSHAHVLQGIEFYNHKPIIYNLGDFIFNNETKDTGIFQIKMNKDGSLEYYFIPCLEQDEYTKTLEGEEKQRVIDNMNSWSINAKMDENGKITEVS